MRKNSRFFLRGRDKGVYCCIHFIFHNMLRPPHLIGLVGYAGVGKDTVASLIIHRLPCSRQGAFADALRAFVSTMNPYLPELGQRYNTVIDEIGYDQAKRQHPCIREMLVCVGHAARQHLGQQCWVNALLTSVPTNVSMVVSDCRYENEVTEIIKLGGEIWYITRPGYLPANSTEAETIPKIISYSCLTLENSGSLEELQQKIEALLKER
jgi:hypothetical protein